MSACADANFATQQSNDPYILQLIQCLNDGTLVVIQLPLLTLIDDILYYVDAKQHAWG